MKKKENHAIHELIKNSTIITLIITLLTILFGFILKEFQKKIEWHYLLSAIVIIIVIFIILLFLIFKSIYPNLKKIAEQTIDKLDEIVTDKVDWILTTPQLIKFESVIKNSEVWLITSDLYEDCIGGPFQECVSNNLKKGVRYHYFVPDTMGVRSKSKQINAVNKNNKDLHFSFLEDDFFFLVSKFDFGIINPFKKGKIERLGFMGLPVPDEKGRYQVKISDELIDIIIGKLLPIYQKYDENKQ